MSGRLKSASVETTKAERPPFRGRQPQQDVKIPPAVLDKLRAQLAPLDGMDASEIIQRLKERQPKAAKILEGKGLLAHVAGALVMESGAAPFSIRSRPDATGDGATVEASALSANGSEPSARDLMDEYAAFKDLILSRREMGDPLPRQEMLQRAQSLADTMRAHLHSKGLSEQNIEFRMKLAVKKAKEKAKAETEDILARALLELDLQATRLELKSMGYKTRTQWAELLSEAKMIKDTRRVDEHILILRLDKLEGIREGVDESSLSREASSASMTAAGVPLQEQEQKEEPLTGFVWPITWQTLATSAASASAYGLLWLSTSGFSSLSDSINRALGTSLAPSEDNLGSALTFSLPVLFEGLASIGNITTLRRINRARGHVMDAFSKVAQYDGAMSQENALKALLMDEGNRNLLLEIDHFVEDGSLLAMARKAGLAPGLRDNIFDKVSAIQYTLVAMKIAPLIKKEQDEQGRYKELRALIKGDRFLRAKIEEHFAKDRKGNYVDEVLRQAVHVALSTTLLPMLRESMPTASDDMLQSRADGDARVLLKKVELDFKRYIEEEEE